MSTYREAGRQASIDALGKQSDRMVVTRGEKKSRAAENQQVANGTRASEQGLLPSYHNQANLIVHCLLSLSLLSSSKLDGKHLRYPKR